ncbi:MAG: C2 family cysteine protease [Candidatus Melainabacteria bacterium]|nr:C2 family cysteine protease [Candidatus Melainabacteria bacterium]
MPEFSQIRENDSVLTIKPQLVHELSAEILANWSLLDRNNNGGIEKSDIDSAIIDKRVTGKLSIAVAALEQVPTISWLAADEKPGISKADIQALKNSSSQETINLPAVTIIQERSKLFDQNGDGSIDRSEFDTVRKKYLDSGSALALASLEFSSIAGRDEKLSQTELTAAVPSSLSVLEEVNKEAKKAEQRLSTSSSYLFGQKGTAEPSYQDIKQGTAFDCYLLAGMASLAAQNPQSIKNMIKETGQNAFAVSFRELKGREISVAKPSDTEKAMYADTSKGQWPLIVELAYGKLRGERNGSQSIAPGENIDFGQGVVAARLLSGEKAFDTPLKNRSKEDLSAELSFSTSHKLPVILSTANPPRDSGLRGFHAYAVLGFDSKTNTVKVMDPYRNLVIPQRDNADGQEDGIFEMTVEELKKNFALITTYDQNK